MLKLDTLPTNTKQHIINKTIKISKIFELTSVPLHKTLKTDSTLNGFYRIFFSNKYEEEGCHTTRAKMECQRANIEYKNALLVVRI